MNIITFIILFIIIYIIFYIINNNIINIENFENNNNIYKHYSNLISNKNIYINSNNNNNIYIYWVGNDYTLIKILRNIIYLHSKSGNGYNVHLINHNNINNYIKELPKNFYELVYAHQADFVRVNVLCDNGGIWLDSDTLIMDNLDSLFNIMNNKDGFFIKENNNILLNGIFGTKKNTELMIEWKNQINNSINNSINKKIKLNWTEIGSKILENIKSKNPSYYNNYTIFNGLDNMYPINWDNCVLEFLDKPYNNYKKIIKKYQPLIVLVNSVYKKINNLTEQQILESKYPLNYFINKSLLSIKK